MWQWSGWEEQRRRRCDECRQMSRGGGRSTLKLRASQSDVAGARKVDGGRGGYRCRGRSPGDELGVQIDQKSEPGPIELVPKAVKLR